MKRAIVDRDKLAVAIIAAFVGIGAHGAKIAPKVRAYLKGLAGEKLAQAKTNILDGIRAKAPRTERGGLCPKAKLPAELAAAYQAASMAMGRALRALNGKGNGGRKSRPFGQFSRDRAAEGIERGQKEENCPPELLAAWQALAAIAEKYE